MPSAVSRQVSELEQWLGIKLLHRTTRSLSLTASGQDYLSRFDVLLTQLADIERSAGQQRESVAGTLRVTTFPYLGRYLMSAVLPDYLAAYPDVSVSLMLTHRIVSLVDEGFDLAIRVGQLQDSDLIAREIGRVRIKTCASPGYLERFGSPFQPADLAGHNCLYDSVLERSNQRWEYQVDGKRVSVPVSGNFVVDGGEIIHDLAISGVGIAYLPDFFVDTAIAAGELVEILGEHAVAEYPVSLVYPRNRQSNRALGCLVDALVDMYPRRAAMLTVRP